jgi:NitT/TauT family transport system substrate-binding protein
MKRIFFTAICVCLIFSGTGYAKTYKIGTAPWIGFSPNNVADAKGFWKLHGADVKVVNFSNAQEMHNALIYKRIDIAHEMLGTWCGLYMDDIPLTMIAELGWSHGGDKIIIKKKMETSGMKGQNIGIYNSTPAVIFFLNKYLAANQMKLSDVRLVEMELEGLADNFIANRFQFIVNCDPAALRAERQGNGKVVASSASYPGCIPEGYAVRTDVLKQIPKDDLAKIFKGWIEAVKWIKDENNWEEYKQILNTKTFEVEKPYSDEDLKQMVDAVRIHDEKMLLERNKDRGDLFLWLNEVKTMLKENNLLKKDFKPEEIFDNSAIKEALQ